MAIKINTYVQVDDTEVRVLDIYPFIYDNENGKMVLRIVIDKDDASYQTIEKMFKNNKLPIDVYTKEISSDGTQEIKNLETRYENFYADFSYSFNTAEYKGNHFIELDKCSDSVIKANQLAKEVEMLNNILLV